jgi:hypothetical protein
VVLCRQSAAANENVRDVVGLYLNPPERAVVLCVDGRECAAARLMPSRQVNAEGRRCRRPSHELWCRLSG